MSIKTKLKWLGLIVLILISYKAANSIYKDSVSIYNNSVNLQTSYDKKVSEQITTYDANYLAFTENKDLANINKETFIVVTDIIMSARKDGQQLAWKWMQENQNIPYHEFTYFYKNLTAFVTDQYATLSRIEREKQEIVATQNTMIKTFPNNIYNKWLKIKPLEYKPGFVSENTKKLFNLK